MEEGRAIVALPEGVALPEVLGGWRSLRQLAKFWHVQANLEVFQHHFLSIRCPLHNEVAKEISEAETFPSLYHFKFLRIFPKYAPQVCVYFVWGSLYGV